MLVVDLTDSRDYDSLYFKTIELIKSSNDKLRSNYLSVFPTDFLSFPAIIENDEIICFSALQTNIDRWGEKIARCSTRMWIHPKKRFVGMTKFTKGSKFLNSFYCIPLQLEKAKKYGYKSIFMSREENPRAFKKWTELVNYNCGTNFIFLPYRYNVCGNLDPVPESCKQFVAVEGSEESLFIWHNNMNKFLIQQD